MKSDFTQLNSEDDLLFFGSGNQPSSQQQTQPRNRENESVVQTPSRIIEPGRKIGSLKDANQVSNDNKNMNHRQRSKQRYTVNKPVQKIEQLVSIQSQDRLSKNLEEVESPSKITNKISTENQEQDIIEEPILNTIHIKEVVKAVKTDRNKEESNTSKGQINDLDTKRGTIESKEESVVQQKPKKSVRKLESLPRVDANEGRPPKQSNIINEERLPRVPNKKFDNLEKIYGVDKGPPAARRV